DPVSRASPAATGSIADSGKTASGMEFTARTLRTVSINWGSSLRSATGIIPPPDFPQPCPTARFPGSLGTPGVESPANVDPSPRCAHPSANRRFRRAVPDAAPLRRWRGTQDVTGGNMSQENLNPEQTPSDQEPETAKEVGDSAQVPPVNDPDSAAPSPWDPPTGQPAGSDTGSGADYGSGGGGDDTTSAQ